MSPASFIKRSRSILSAGAVAMMVIAGPASAATLIDATVNGRVGDTNLDGSPDGFNYDDFGVLYAPNATREDRGIAEFNLGGLSVPLASASLELTSSYARGSGQISLYGYAGDGAIKLSDWTLGQSGMLLSSFAYTAGDGDLSLDVTDFVNGLLGTGGGFAGFMMKLDSPTDLTRFDFGKLSNGTNAVLSVTMAPVPLPAGLPMLLAGLGVIGIVRRRRS